MSFNPRHFRELIVRPTLNEMQMFSFAAEELLLLTAAIESDFGTFLRQNGSNGGFSVGRGVYSMEPETYYWLKGIPRYTQWLYGLADDLVCDLRLATRAARLRYRIVPEALPNETDIEGLAKYWKKYYNASSNGASVEEAVAKYERLCIRPEVQWG